MQRQLFTGCSEELRIRRVLRARASSSEAGCESEEQAKRGAERDYATRWGEKVRAIQEGV